ncbi:hypothetical protein GCM10017687_63120 [Streptomyces echinatus]
MPNAAASTAAKVVIRSPVFMVTPRLLAVRKRLEGLQHTPGGYGVKRAIPRSRASLRIRVGGIPLGRARSGGGSLEVRARRAAVDMTPRHLMITLRM